VLGSREFCLKAARFRQPPVKTVLQQHSVGYFDEVPIDYKSIHEIPMKKLRSSTTWLFFVLTFAWSWAFWVPTALWAPDATHFITQLGFGLGGIGPMIFGIYFTYQEGREKIRRDYWRRVADWKRLGFQGWFLALLVVPILTLLAGWLDQLLGGNGIKLDLTTLDYFTRSFSLLPGFLLFLLFMFLFGPVPEEMGWRGYALDHLRGKYGSLGASLVLGLFWGLWHLPLFFLKGAYQSTLGVGTVGFFLFFAAIIPLSVVITWIYDLTNRSILSAILIHFSVNLVGTVAAHGNQVEMLRVLLCWVWAIGVVYSWKLGNKRLF
jgi:uncharacterized protein